MVSVLSSIDVSDQLKDYAKLTDITKSRIDSVLGSTTAGNANRFLMSTGSTSVWAAISDYALPLSGGTLYNGDSDAPLYIKSNIGAAYIGFKNSSDAFLGYYGFNDTTPTVYIGTSAEYNIIHSGNIGSYALKTDGSNSMGTSAYIPWATSECAEDYSAYGDGFRILKSNVSSGNYRGGIHGGGRYGWQLTREAGNEILQVRFNRGGTSTWEGWKTIAFTDSNVASATKLQTARTIWGQSFDGTGNVDGVLYMGGRDVLSKKSNALYIGYLSSTDDSLPTYLWGKGINFINSGGQTRMFIADGGNVGIGNPDPQYKLDVNGPISANEVYIQNSSYSTTGEGSFLIRFYNGNLQFNSRTASGSSNAVPLIINHETSASTFNGAVTMSSTFTAAGGEISGAMTSYGGFISYGTPSFTAIRESGWSYLRLQSASHMWDIATTNASDGMLNTPYALEFRDGGQGYWGFALRYNTSSYGIGVFVANGAEASIGFLSNSSASSNKLPQWVIGNKDAETFGFWNTSSARFGITISKEFSTNVEGNICINRPTNYSNNYDEGLRCNLGGSTSWAGVVIGGAAFSTSGAGVGVYSLLVNNQLFRIRQNHTDVLTMNTSNQVNINGNLVVSGDTSNGSDIRFKDIIKNKTIKIADIAKAPLFTFKWNDREDDTIHLGSSAQYWEKVTPWLVKGEDFKTLVYSTLGVAIGISLAKKAVNHEERIKELERKVKSLEEENRRLRHGN